LPAVNAGGPVSRVVLGEYQTCALLSSGDVRCWGKASELGRGDSSEDIGDDETPSSIQPLALGGRAIDIVADKAVCVLLENGAVRCFGSGGSFYNGYATPGYSNVGFGKIGDDELPTERPAVPLGYKATKIMAAQGFFCATSAMHVVRCWDNGTSPNFVYENFGEYEYLVPLRLLSTLNDEWEERMNALIQEHGNTYTAAEEIAASQMQGDAIFPVGDIDWYELELSATSSLRLTTSGLLDSAPCPGDTRLRLYKGQSSGAPVQLGENDNRSDGSLCAQIDPSTHAFAANLTAGTYYIRVEESGNDAAITDFYRLKVETIP
jgi:hypothetical protein